MSFDFEPQWHENCRSQQALEKRIKTYRLKRFDPDLHLWYSLHGRGIEIMLFGNQKECYTTCVSLKKTKRRHLSKVKVNNKLHNTKKPSKLWGKGWLGQRKRLDCRGYLRQKNRDGLGAVLCILKWLHAAQNANKPRSPQRIRRHTMCCRPEQSSDLETDVLY